MKFHFNLVIATAGHEQKLAEQSIYFSLLYHETACPRVPPLTKRIKASILELELIFDVSETTRINSFE